MNGHRKGLVGELCDPKGPRHPGRGAQAADAFRLQVAGSAIDCGGSIDPGGGFG
ncbi:hypothetical protein MPNT_300006 [Candidatus Methylacidithermus pantelleriae]|uniref:Uncharacterized protein n=1 Tax=Candidatus Methylacidithermus pantelleriae TaxID=2744239 RepID=A0A8J2BQN2_9BACT|nr:hypothetical protein MPNT_300006 [Candidatus Methylacidithermus pantelleriae]